jgi:hypothetical protein
VYNKKVEINEVKAVQGKAIAFFSPKILLDPIKHTKLKEESRPGIRRLSLKNQHYARENINSRSMGLLLAMYILFNKFGNFFRFAV